MVSDTNEEALSGYARIAEAMKSYVDQQNAETREGFERAQQEWARAVNESLEMVSGWMQNVMTRVAALEARDGTEQYRAWVLEQVTELGISPVEVAKAARGEEE